MRLQVIGVVPAKFFREGPRAGEQQYPAKAKCLLPTLVDGYETTFPAELELSQQAEGVCAGKGEFDVVFGFKADPVSRQFGDDDRRHYVQSVVNAIVHAKRVIASPEVPPVHRSAMPAVPVAAGK